MGISFSIVRFAVKTGGLRDRYGRLAVDEALRRTARSVSLLLRPYDSLSRCGEDGFALLLSGRGEQEAHDVAERVRTCAADVRIGERTGFTLEWGIAVWPGDGSDSEGLLESALRRMDRRYGQNGERPGSLILKEG
jgi:diguanylate cyclase (GGDEF)-like protein